MCNMVHRNQEFEKIPKTGEAWKLFRKYTDLHTGPLFSGSYVHKTNKAGWVVWDHKLAGKSNETLTHKRDSGFCAFATKEEAVQARTSLLKAGTFYNKPNNITYHKVIYTNGIGACGSMEMDGEWRRFIFFKRFKVVED